MVNKKSFLQQIKVASHPTKLIILLKIFEDESISMLRLSKELNMIYNNLRAHVDELIKYKILTKEIIIYSEGRKAVLHINKDIKELLKNVNNMIKNTKQEDKDFLLACISEQKAPSLSEIYFYLMFPKISFSEVLESLEAEGLIYTTHRLTKRGRKYVQEKKLNLKELE